MLRNFRQVFKGNQAPMAVIMMVVLLGMVAYLAPSHGNPDAPDNIVARVYGRDITRRDLEGPMREMAKRLGKGADLDSLAPLMQNQAISQLVQAKLIEELAERHGIVVTDGEVKQALEAQLRAYGFADQNNHLRPSAEINDILREHGMSLKQMEIDFRSVLAGQKLFQQASAQVPVDEAWLNLENRVRNEKVSFEAATQTPDPSQVPDPGQPKLEAFLKDSGARFQAGPRRVIAYVSLNAAALSIAPADDAAVQAVYDARKGQFLELKASHILIKAQSDAQVQEAMKKALDLRAKLLAGQDFNKTAEAVSEDPSAKGNKGDLGWFQTGQMEKAFEQAAMGLKVGEISQPVRTGFGIHLIRLEGRREKSFDQVKDQLRQQLTQERFSTKAKDRLEQLRKRTGDRGDLITAAKNLGLKVQTSPAFTRDSAAGVDGLPGSQGVVNEAFRLDVGQVSKIQQVQDSFLVFRVQEERPIAIPAFAEIKDQVLAAWKLEQARRTALAKAKDGLKGGDLKAVGSPVDQAAVSIASLGELGQHPAIRKALLDTPVGQLTPVLWTPDGKLWVARIKARTPAAPLTFTTRKALVEQVQQDVAQKFLSAELQTLEREGSLHPGFSSLYGRFNGIWRNKEVLGKGIDSVPDLSGLDD
ncbi:MAG: peptidyl-prolyl cis-trans isomerase [Holophaga sp.]|nr:peptidyl-prolyl cis-trans isomerase [Holophaga sp.]